MKQKKVRGTFTRTRRIMAISSLLVLLSSCGVTKATISKPAEGTTTTITITTNNPISTDIKPNLETNPKN